MKKGVYFNFLKFDSDVFGINIFDLVTDMLDDIDIGHLLNEIKALEFDVIQAKIPLEKSKYIRILEKLGFSFIDLHITFKKFIAPNEDKLKSVEDIKIEFASIQDVEHINKIIDTSIYSHSRFLAMNIPPKAVDNFYKIWAKKAILGEFDDFCLLAKIENITAGFITCKLLNDREARIGLIGVDKGLQGRNVGSFLINNLENILYNRGISILYATTEGSNIRAQNFYIKNGFIVHQIMSILYLWRGT